MRTRRLLDPLATLAIASALLVGCGGGGEDTSATRPLRTEDPGYALYQKLICQRCHGGDLEGGFKAPPLLELGQHYDAATLIAYLRDPDAMQASDPRLHELDANYTSFEMPSYAMLDSSSCAILVEFLLDPWRKELP